MNDRQKHLAAETTRRVGGGVLLFLLYLFLLAPLLIVVVVSFDPSSVISFPPKGFTFDWYAALLSNEAFTRGFFNSLVVASVVTVITTAVSIPAALALARYSFPGRAAIKSFLLAPILIPTVVLGLAMLLVLAPFGLIGTYAGLVTAHLAIAIPYVVRVITMNLETMDRASEEASRVLGAGAFTTFRRVTLPLIAPGVLAGAFFAFLISFDEAVISLFVVGTGAGTLPVAIYKYVITKTDPQIAALSVVLVLFSILIMVGVEKAVGLRRSVVVK